MASTNLQGKACQTSGDLPSQNNSAPDFVLVNFKLEDKSLNDFKDKRKLLYIVPSLDTMVCANTSKKLNELASGHSQADFLVISKDLPFAQQRFCKQNKLKNLNALSIMRSDKFAEDYGVLLIDGPLAGLTARAVLVLDEDNQILFSELMRDITEEPDFEKALKYLQV